ncbi:MAG: DUF1826 domain-containing protein [Verrucomicrobiota bacterium]
MIAGKTARHVQDTTEDSVRGILGGIGLPGVPVVQWERDLPEGVAAAIRSWLQAGNCEVDEKVEVGRPDVRDLVEDTLAENGWSGDSYVRDWLIDDLTELLLLFGDLANTPYVRFRLNAVRDGGCRKFHVDNIALRMLCTYVGPGTEWASAAAVCREELGCAAESVEAANRRIIPDAAAIQHAPSGAVLLCKGNRYPGEEGHGLVHRSAPVSGPEQDRLRLCIDSYAIDTEELVLKPASNLSKLRS